MLANTGDILTLRLFTLVVAKMMSCHSAHCPWARLSAMLRVAMSVGKKRKKEEKKRGGWVEGK